MAQAREFVYLGVMFISYKRTDLALKGWLGAAATVLHALYWAGAVLRSKALDLPVHVMSQPSPIVLTSPHGLWIVSET